MSARNTKNPPVSGKNTGGFQNNYQSSSQRQYTNIAACVEEFRGFVRAEYGLVLVGDLRADGHFHGSATEEDRGGSKPFRYCVNIDPPANIYFTDLKRGFHGLWFPRD